MNRSERALIVQALRVANQHGIRQDGVDAVELADRLERFLGQRIEDGKIVFDDVDAVVKYFRPVVEAFMRGEETPMHQPHGHHSNVPEAHIWVSAHHSKHPWDDPAKHVVFETLVIEPNGTSGPGQYECAVRVLTAGNEMPGYSNHSAYVPGYVASVDGLSGRGIDH